MIREIMLLALNKITDQLGQLIQVPEPKLSPLVRVIEDLANGSLRVVVSKKEIPTQGTMSTTVANFATVGKKGGKA